MIGTPLQAIKFATTARFSASHFHAFDFLQEWLKGKIEGEELQELTAFCKANPDEPERTDGRKLHYGTGRQPLDDIIDAGWGGAFCAGNVLKYLRRDKQIEDSQIKARWYWNKLNELLDYRINGYDQSTKAKGQLVNLLKDRELVFLETGCMPKE